MQFYYFDSPHKQIMEDFEVPDEYSHLDKEEYGQLVIKYVND